MGLISASSTNSSSAKLSTSYLSSLIKQMMSAQRQPINKLKAQKDALNVKKAIYSDLKDKLILLRDVAKNLTLSDVNTVFDNMRALSSDSSVLTATATTSALDGTYTITVTNLAESQMVRSDQQTSSTDALNLSGTFSLNGVSIEVESDDSLQDIAEAINDADYEDGEEVKATIVDDHLVLEADSTGTANEISASDTDGSVLTSLGLLDGTGAFKTVLRDAEDAAFSVNGIEVTRSSNTDLDDVIEGVTLTLKDEGEDVTLDVGKNHTDIQMKVSAFAKNLNSTVAYLTQKMTTTVDQNSKEYTRGALVGDTVFSRLRVDLFSAMRTHVDAVAEGDPETLEDIGLTLGSGLSISLNESDLLDALNTNFEGTVNLLDRAMDSFLDTLRQFTTSSSLSNTLDIYITSVETRMDNIDNRVSAMEKNLSVREDTLIQQYSALYLRNIDFTQQQYNMISIYSSFSIKA